jgi:hypothetical protein
MRKKNLFLSILAGLTLIGCSSENDVLTGGDTDPVNKSTSYMAVNLMSSDVMGTRALAGYEDGASEENKVTSVRFYFFNGAGGAVNVKYQTNGSYVNYYDWTPGDTNQESGTVDGDDIESKLKATIVINTAGGDKIPQRIAAVLNPTGLDNNSKSLSELKAIVADYAASGLTTNGKFVMFNSVGGGGKDFSTTLIEKTNLCKSEKEALNNPVTIYVERSVAKVRVTLGTAVSAAGTTTGLALKDKDDKDILVDGKPVYLKLDGWGLTAETSEGRLIKKINPGWEGTGWYKDHRSFWAINSKTATNKYKNYGDIDTSFGEGNALYTNENAQLTDVDGSEGQAKERTKVIFKGTLCKKDGTPLTIVRHLGAYFGDTESEAESTNLIELKKSILNQLAANGKHYYYATTGGREQIGTGDLQIVIASQQDASKKSCYVYAQLTDDAAKNKTWYNSMEASAQPIDNAANEINGYLANPDVVDRALVWKSGMTYYYHEIEHKYGETNQFGVVRNHIYAVNVTAIAGLGTPVYDPDQIIYPETPGGNSHYIAAQINILSWRVVNNDVQLGK